MKSSHALRLGMICGALALLSGCYKLDVGNGQLRCSVPDKTCPTNFHCASDGYCWKNGQNPSAGGDMAQPPGAGDMTPPPAADMTGMTVIDMATPVDMAQLPPQANKGAVVVSGGVTAQSAHYKIIMSTGQAPGGNVNASSSSYQLKSGLPALSQ